MADPENNSENEPDSVTRQIALSGKGRERMSKWIFVGAVYWLVLYVCMPQAQILLRYAFFLPVILSALVLGFRTSGILVCLATLAGFSSMLWQSPQVFNTTLTENATWALFLLIASGSISAFVGIRDSELSATLTEHENLITLDPLTGIANRRNFDLILGQRISELNRHNRPLSILMIDVDHFKQFNDCYGHSFGDKVLKEIAEIIQRCLRNEDAVARIGGEEFAVVLPETDLADALPVAERIRHSVENFEMEELSGRKELTVSIGAVQSSDSCNQETLLQRADFLMYQAKNEGRNRICYDQIKNEGDSSNKTTGQIKVLEKVFECEARRGLATNSVTGLINGHAFEAELNRRVYESARYKTSLSVGLFEIVDVMDTEDKMELLKDEIFQISNCIVGELRLSDLVAWLKPDQFAILLPSTTLENARQVLERTFAITRESVSLKSLKLCGFSVSDHKRPELASDMLKRLRENLRQKRNAKNPELAFSSNDGLGFIV